MRNPSFGFLTILSCQVENSFDRLIYEEGDVESWLIVLFFRFVIFTFLQNGTDHHRIMSIRSNLQLKLKVLLRSKNIFIFPSDFETLFTKQSPREILDLNFEKKTVYSNYNFTI